MNSKRLSRIEELIDEGAVVADIGCDHGYLCIDLIKKKIAGKCYAMDVAEGPLNQAKKAIEKQSLNIETILSDGLDKCPEDVDTVVIAGMGWMTIHAILMKNLEKCVWFKKIILQPNRDLDECRKWISDHGFTILDETLVEDKKFYEIIVMNLKNHEPYCEEDIYFGPFIRKKKDECFHKYYRQRLKKLNQVLPGCSKEEDISRIRSQIEMIKKEIE